MQNLGRVAERLGHWMQAREAFESSLALSRDIGYARGEAYALRGLAAVANQQDDPAADTVLRSVASQLSDDAALYRAKRSGRNCVMVESASPA